MKPPRAFLVRTLVSLFTLLVFTGCHSPARQGRLSPASVAHADGGVPAFDGAQAFTFLTDQCAMGPRVPNKKAHDVCQEYIIKQLRPYVDAVGTQNFDWQDNHRHVKLHLTNIFGVINPSASQKIMICAHWDTRPTADEDFDVENREKPIPGADDGASGVAVLLELARIFHSQRPKTGVILAFWDGEDWGPDDPEMYLGARYFAKHPGPYKPNKSILLDMIGQEGLVIPREQYSQDHFPALDDEVWNAAHSLGYTTQFPDAVKYQIYDDQIPLGDAGVPSIDLID
ncbi:MAG TPA: M28 family peptidase, partial [Capsulimonadaceae bacterium]|nr:M28 family peptidase [Capsulimonadaceae bacterium]